MPPKSQKRLTVANQSATVNPQSRGQRSNARIPAGQLTLDTFWTSKPNVPAVAPVPIPLTVATARPPLPVDALRVGPSSSNHPQFDAHPIRVDLASRASDMDILRHFDLNHTFGPCAGISRMQRWNRAERHMQNPPLEVKRLVEAHPNDPDYVECIWYGTNAM